MKTARGGAERRTPPRIVRARAAKGASGAPARRSSLDLALLGLIAEGPLSGYDIVKIFNLSMAHFWHAHHGQIYPTLERMRARGWIESRDVIQRGRPNKRVYTIGEAGRARLSEWLDSAPEAMKLKIPALLRCRFLGHAGVAGAKEGLDRQGEQWARYLAVYRDLERRYFRDASGRLRYVGRDAMFSYFTLRFGISFLENNLRWCRWAAAEIDRHAALFLKSAAPGRGRSARAG